MSRWRPPVQDSFDGRTFDYDTYYRNTVENQLTGTRLPDDPRIALAIQRHNWNLRRGVKQYGITDASPK